MKEAFDLMKRKIIQDRRIGRSSLEAFLEILKEVEAEFATDTNIGSNTSTEHINKSTEHINKPGDCSTNADRIRAMSDEDLAEYLHGVSESTKPCVRCEEECDFCEHSEEECKRKVLNWLQEECTELF